MSVKSKKILTSKEEIMAYIGVGSSLYQHFCKLGLPVVTVNGRQYAHAEVVDDWFKRILAKKTSLEIPEPNP